MTQKDGSYQYKRNQDDMCTQLVHVTCAFAQYGKKYMNIETMLTDKIDDANEKWQFHISSAKCITE